MVEKRFSWVFLLCCMRLRSLKEANNCSVFIVARSQESLASSILEVSIASPALKLVKLWEYLQYTYCVLKAIIQSDYLN